MVFGLLIGDAMRGILLFCGGTSLAIFITSILYYNVILFLYYNVRLVDFIFYFLL
jgi:hypothetical protein